MTHLNKDEYKMVEVTLSILLITFFASYLSVFTGDVVLGRDFAASHVPLASLIYQTEMYPILWNPFSHNGTPALANPIYIMLSPFQALNLWIQPVYVQLFILFSHLFLLFSGAYNWVREFGFSQRNCLTVTAIFAGSFPIFSLLEYGHLLVIVCYSYSIWNFVFIQRVLKKELNLKTCLNFISKIALVNGMMLLSAGLQNIHHQFVAIAIYLLLLFGIESRNRKVLYVLFATLVGHILSGLCAWAQLSSTVRFLSESARSESIGSFDLMTEGQYTFNLLIKFFFPFIYGISSSYWGQHDFFFTQLSFGVFGMFMLLMGLFKIKKKIIVTSTIAGIIVFLLTLGDNTPLFYLYSKVTPLASYFRYPSRYIYPCLIFVLPLMSYGIMKIENKGFNKKMLFLFLGLFTTASLLLSSKSILDTLFLYVLPEKALMRYDAISVSNSSYTYVYLIFQLSGFYCFYKYILSSRRSYVFLYLGLISLISVYSFMPKFRVPIDSVMAEKVEPDPNKRLLVVDVMMNPNNHLFESKLTTAGYDSFYPFSYRKLLDCMVEQNWKKKTRNQFNRMKDHDKKLLGVTHELREGDRLNVDEVYPVETPGELYFLTQSFDLPTRKESPYFKGIEETMAEIRASSGIEESLQNNLGEVVLKEYAPEYVSLDIRVDKASILASSENYSGNWKCFVDGVERDIMPWLGTFRSIYLKEGDHRVEYKYDRSVFYRNLSISMMSFLVLILVLCITNRGHKVLISGTT